MNIRSVISFEDYAGRMLNPKTTRARGKTPAWLDELDECMHVITATRDIKAGEELFMYYGDDYWSHRPQDIPIWYKEHQQVQQKHDSYDGSEEY
jgi:hypothetical protein